MKKNNTIPALMNNAGVNLASITVELVKNTDKAKLSVNQEIS